MARLASFWLFALALFAGVANFREAAALPAAFDKEKAAKFISRGYYLLAKASELPQQGAVNADSGSRVYREDTECKVTCNGEVLEEHECVGRTEVQCLSVPEQQPGNNTQLVDVYMRRCDGKFVNETHAMGEEFDTSQACTGLSTLTMREEHLDSETGTWVTDYSYKKTCATRFAMQVITITSEAEQEPDETQVVTLCEGSAATYADNPDDSKPQPHESGPEANVTCDGEATDWETPCAGVFRSEFDNGETVATTECSGKWSPYVANWECIGNYTFVHVTWLSETHYNALERQCGGTTLISAVAYEEGYQVCNGESKFNEMYTVPVVRAT